MSSQHVSAPGLRGRGLGRVSRRGARLALLAALAVSPAAGGCGTTHRLQRAAEPAVAPPLAAKPRGRVLTLRAPAEGVAVDSSAGLVAVALREPPSLGIYDARSGSRVRRVALPESARHLGLGPGGTVLVPAERADALVQVSIRTGATRTLRVGRFPHDATAAEGRVFVTDEKGDRLTVVVGDRVLGTLRTPIQPGGVVAAAGRVGVVAVRQRVLALYDAASLHRVGQVPAGTGPTHAVAGQDGRLYVVDTQGGAVLTFAVRPRLALVARTPLAGAPYGVAIDPRRGRLWVTLTGRNQVAELALTGAGAPRVVARYPTVRQPNSVGVDTRTGRLFIASRSEGQLQLFDPPGGP